MLSPPEITAEGVFSREVRLDVAVYGLLIGSFSLATYAVIVYGFYGGVTGLNCNDAVSPLCEGVFRARAATFATLGLLLLVNAFDCRHPRRTLRQLGVFGNPALLLAFALGVGSLVALIYIPYVNTELLKCAPISWEWAVPVVCAICMTVLVQAYKRAKERWWPLAGVLAARPAVSGRRTAGEAMLPVV